jgi:hypothetical protein
MKSMTITVGQIDDFNEGDKSALAASDATDFVLIPDYASSYGTTENGYKTQLAPKLINFINTMITLRSNVKIWIGTPGISHANYSIASTSLNPFYNHITYIQSQLGSQKWSNNIAGIYMNQESVYGTVNYLNLLANSEIKLMNDLSYRVHANLGKKFLWIPYYGFGTNAATIIKNLGYIANKTNIYDFVVIQPHYYFDPSVYANLSGVYQSIQKQSVTYRDGVVVVSKTSNTVIGVEMEISGAVTYASPDPAYLV